MQNWSFFWTDEANCFVCFICLYQVEYELTFTMIMLLIIKITLYRKEYKEFYIGYKRDILNNLVTLDGRLQTWAPWEGDEPSGGSKDTCVSSFNRDGTFWDEDCTYTYYAICQWPKFLGRINIHNINIYICILCIYMDNCFLSI